MHQAVDRRTPAANRARRRLSQPSFYARWVKRVPAGWNAHRRLDPKQLRHANGAVSEFTPFQQRSPERSSAARAVMRLTAQTQQEKLPRCNGCSARTRGICGHRSDAIESATPHCCRVGQSCLLSIPTTRCRCCSFDAAVCEGAVPPPFHPR
jgi:hypothetical protein